MNKKIAIIYQYSILNSIGGGEKRLFEIFKRYNGQVDWYIQYFPKQYKKLENINFISLNKKQFRKRSYSETVNWITSVFGIPIEKYDLIVIGQMPFFHIPILQKKCESKKVSYIIEYWEYWGSHWKKFNPIISLMGKKVENFILNRVENAVVISKNTFNILKSRYQINNLEYIPNGINMDYIKSLPSIKKYDFVYFGRLEKHKRVDKSILVFKELFKKNKNYKMAIIGSGSYQIELEKLVRKLKLNNNVFFLGALENKEMLSIVKGAKFFLFFSEQEGGSSLTFLESNACGTPVVHSFSVNGLDKEMFKENNSLFFDTFNENMIANSIQKILENEMLYNTIKDNAIRFANKYDWNRIVSQYISYINNILEK